MTPQEAKQRLERIWEDYTSAYDTASIEDLMAFDMATNALGAIDQIQWERDMAIKQLHDLGYGLGEKPREDANNSNQEVKKSSDGDTVSRQAVIDFINGITNMDLKAKGGLVLGIKFMPAVKQEPCNDAVSRKALLHIFEEQCYPVHYDHNSVDVGMTLPGIVEVLNIAPSVQPEIVRCKDCKRYNACEDYCTVWGRRSAPYWYCNFGERRTDE